MVGLGSVDGKKVRYFSMGMKQRLGIAVALLNNPSCLLLDEPFSGLDPLGIEALKQLILNLKQQTQMSILISSHIIDVLSTVCTKLSIIHNGEIIQSGETSTILSACTKSYTLCGNNIKKASFLSDYETVSNGECMTISASASEICPRLFIKSCSALKTERDRSAAMIVRRLRAERRSCWLIRSCRIRSRSFFTCIGVVSSKAAAGVPGRTQALERYIHVVHDRAHHHCRLLRR